MYIEKISDSKEYKRLINQFEDYFEEKIPTYKKGSSTLVIFKVNDDYLIQNELVLIRCSKEGRVKWYSDLRQDIIYSIEIKENIIEVEEFDGVCKYSLDLDTGKDTKTGKINHHKIIKSK